MGLKDDATITQPPTTAGNGTPFRPHPIHMFANILLGILLLTCIGMVFLLVMPSQDKRPRVPFMGIALFVGLTLLALVGAFSVTA